MAKHLKSGPAKVHNKHMFYVLPYRYTPKTPKGPLPVGRIERVMPESRGRRRLQESLTKGKRLDIYC